MLDLHTLQPGTRLRLAGGVVAEVVGAVDGEWVRVRLGEVPAGKGAVGDEELCHATDIVEVL
ncbi:MAG TPA: hypothetical protein VIJ55_08115 [Acetobacteraceae bacterium]